MSRRAATYPRTEAIGREISTMTIGLLEIGIFVGLFIALVVAVIVLWQRQAR